MKAKHIITLITALVLLTMVFGTVMYYMSTIKDEIDITDTASKVFDEFKAKAINTGVDSLTQKEEKVAEHWDDVKYICFSTMDDIVKNYAKSAIDYQKAINALRCYSLFPVTSSELDSYIKNVNKIESGRKAFDQAEKEKDPLEAALLYIKVDENDSSLYHMAKMRMQEILDREILKADTYKKLSQNIIDPTLETLYAIEKMLPKEKSIADLINYVESYKASQEATVKFKGQIEVLTVRNLMAFPEIVYADGSAYADSYDSSLITPTEFGNILNELYKNDYILISVNSLSEDNINSPEVPAGKKPLILIVEDLTYHRANLGSGVNGRLTVDEEGELCTVSGTLTSYENESVTILETFLREHPDFTYKGARGCISLTGYDGLFGHDITTNDGKAEAQRVADCLIAQGWTFASQSYSHADMYNATVDTIRWDTEKWAETVESIVGNAEVYIWPYGSHVRNGEKHSYLYEQGYRIFLGLGITPYRAIEPDGKGIFLDRRSLTGYALRTYKEEYAHLFDTDKVIDTIRPKKDQDN